MHAAASAFVRKSSLTSLHHFFRSPTSGRRRQIGCIVFCPLPLLCQRLASQSAWLSRESHIGRHSLVVKAARKESPVDDATFEEWLAANPLPSLSNHRVQSPERKGEEGNLPSSSQDLCTGPVLNGQGRNNEEAWDQLGAKRCDSALSDKEGADTQVAPAITFQCPPIDWSKIENGAPMVRSCFLDSLNEYRKSSNGSLPQWRSFGWQETREALRRLPIEGRQLRWCPESRSFVEVDPNTGAPVFAFVPPSVQCWQLKQGAMMTAGQFLDHLQQGQVSKQDTSPSARQKVYQRKLESKMQLSVGVKSTEGSVSNESQSCPELQASGLPSMQSIEELCNDRVVSDLGVHSLEESSCSLATQNKQRPDQRRRLQRSFPLCRKEKHLVVLLTSAAAALCIWEDGRLARHKVITAYTVRAKQGKSQLNHMRGRTGGGLSVGGSLRMQETARLFIRINEVR